MWFLLIPLTVFLLLTALIYIFINTISGSQRHTGRLSHLELICSIVGTATLGEKRFSCWVPRRVTRLDIIFMGRVVRVELPLITASQRKHASKLLQAFADFDGSRLDAVDDKSRSKIVGYYKGRKENLPAAISQLYQGVFGVQENHPVNYEIDVHDRDDALIASDWERYYKPQPAGHNEPPVASARTEDIIASRRGCMVPLTRLIFLPLVTASIYYFLGITPAIVFVLVTSLLLIGRRLLKKGFSDFSKPWDWPFFITPIGAISALWMSDILYFQIIPSAYCVVFGAIGLYGTLTARLIFPNMSDEKAPLTFTSTESRLFGLAAALVSAVGFWINEHLRMHGSLEAWIWYYVYFRVEIMLGYLVLTVPVIMRVARRHVDKTSSEGAEA